jgi:tetratricopeptide (TPR) repeat protein
MLMKIPWTILVLSLVFQAGFIQPALALGEFEQGCQFYKLKDYKQARSCFEKAVSEFPNSWAVRYYLANTYLASGQASNAKRQYEACLKCRPSAATAAYCRDAISKLGGSSPASTPGSPATAGGDVNSSVAADKSPDAKSMDSKSADVSSPTLTHERARAAETMKKAEAECDKIRAETKELLANGAKLSNQRWILPDGSPYVDWTDPQREQITRDADERCKRIMDQAIRSTAHIQN